MKEKILYAITSSDVMNILGKNKYFPTEQDFCFIADKIGDFFGDHWCSAVEYALGELKRKNSRYGVNKRT